MPGSIRTNPPSPRAARLASSGAKCADAGLGPLDEASHRAARGPERAQPGVQRLGFLALPFVDDLEERRGLRGIDLLRRHEFVPDRAVADAHGEVLRAEAEGAERVDPEGDQFGIRLDRRLAQHVAVPLVELAQPAFLRSLVAEATADLKPLERLLELAMPGRDEAGERRGQFRPQGDLALTLVGEVEKLLDDFLAALAPIEVGRFQHRPLPLGESVAARDSAATSRRRSSAPRTRAGKSPGIPAVIGVAGSC